MKLWQKVKLVFARNSSPTPTSLTNENQLIESLSEKAYLKLLDDTLNDKIFWKESREDLDFFFNPQRSYEYSNYRITHIFYDDFSYRLYFKGERLELSNEREKLEELWLAIVNRISRVNENKRRKILKELPV